MSEDAYAMKDGKLVRTEAFGEPITRKYDYMENEITFTEHCHDEPIQYFLNAKEYFKGVKNVYFKYAGDGMDFCKPLRRAGLLSHEKEDINGVMVSPFEVIAKHLPHPPKFKEEIQAIIDEGLYEDSGAMVAEAYGKKDGKDILVEVHMDAPGLIDSFKKAGLTAEMYLTGQGGYLYSKMLINNDFDTKGLFTSDMLTMEQVDRYMEYAGELDIYFKTTIKEL
jgi:saccharopine dehydrogenase-like NADP-dependent oxidoreductase